MDLQPFIKEKKKGLDENKDVSNIKSAHQLCSFKLFQKVNILVKKLTTV